jgi:ribosomal protein S18 acetylase RimI-like enzyme
MLDSPVSLRPLPEERFAAFLERSVAEYATARVAAVGTTMDAALRNARAQTSALLPQGFATPGHRLYEVMEGEIAVGHLWIGTTEGDGFRNAFVYDVWLREDARGRGVGRQVMMLAEDVAQSLGARDLELYVFAHNARARRLYESLGFRTVNMGMRKTLGG